MRIKSIRSARISVKLTFIYALMFSLVLVILNLSVLYALRSYIYFQATKQLDQTKTMILSEAASKSDHVDLSDSELISDIPGKENIFVRVVDKKGRIINKSHQFYFDIRTDGPYEKIMYSKEKDKYLIYENVEFASKQYGTVYIQIIKIMNNEYNYMKVLFIIMAFASLIGIIASVFIGYMVSKRMLTPIAKISETAQNISINNLKERIEVQGPDDELKRLADTFNNMIDGLQEAFDRQTQFVSDASHELRTPIAVVQGYANLLDRWGKNDTEALEKSIKAIKFEATNMAELVGELLFLAKGESGTQSVEKEDFPLNELISEVVEESRIIAPEHLITNNKNDITNIHADYKMLKQMLRIFIDNSIKFTPCGGNIDISSVSYDDLVKIIISDAGIGIPKNEIANIFERFYRVDKSRSKEKGGSGLGLSIAKWIVDKHNGTIRVDSEEGRGTSITITLNLRKCTME